MNIQRAIPAGGLLWNVVEAGQGPVVLLVHGTAASVHSWRDVIPLLSDSFRVITMDLPGHGGTGHRSSADLSLDGMGNGLVALTKELGISPSIVVGHSAGAAVLAWACARKKLTPETYISFNGAFYPFSGIAGSLFSPIAKLIAINPFVPRLVSNFASRTKVEKLLKDTGSTISPEGVDYYYNLYKEPSHVAAALGMMAAWDLRGMDDNLVRIEAECVFVAGGNDKAVPPETAARAAARCRKAKHLQIAGFGHLLHEENPQCAADIIRGQRK
jgi:magnesium chelatase accessory protein